MSARPARVAARQTCPQMVDPLQSACAMASTLAHAIGHATRSLTVAYDWLHLERPSDSPQSPSHEQAEERVRAEAARVSELVERTYGGRRVDAATLETAADELDQDVASFDEMLEAEAREAEP